MKHAQSAFIHATHSIGAPAPPRLEADTWRLIPDGTGRFFFCLNPSLRMPWSKETDHDDCDGIAVVKDSTGEVEGCHETEEEANDQIAALNASEDDRAVSDVDLSPPAAMVNAAQMGLAKKDELSLGDCGTGAGETSARMIVNDELTPGRVRKIAGYLRSHAEDYTPEGTPSTLSDEQLRDGCGTIQYLLWGGGTDTAYNWALRKANEVAKEQGDSKPYTDSDFRSMTRADVDDLSEGDLVAWDSSGGTAYGRIDQIAMGETVSGSLEPSDTEHETSEDNPGVIIEIVENDDGEVEGTGDTVFHRPETLTMIEEGDVPERSEARDYEGRMFQSRITDPSIRETADGKITVKVMTDQIARDGMVLDPEGLRTEDYEKNPVVLWEHGQDPRRGAEPVARCVNLMRKQDGYLAEVEFAGDEFAQRIEDKIRGGYINAVSVGWKTEDVQREERSGEMVPVVRQSDMTEFSVVGVPADTDALVQSRVHYKGMEEEMEEEWPAHRSLIKGLCVAEAARRAMGSDMMMEQAKKDVLDEMDERLIGGRKCVMGPKCPFHDDPTQFDTLADILSADAEILRMTAAAEGCRYDTEMQGNSTDSTGRDDCDCNDRDAGEGTPSSPSASDGTPTDAERDESPGTDYVTMQDFFRLLQEKKGEVKEIRREKAKKEAQKELGIR